MREHQQASRLREHLRENAEKYFPPFAGRNVSVDVVSTSRRRYSFTFMLRVRDSANERFVFAKQPLDSPALRQSTSDVQGDRPRLVPLLSAAVETKLEHAALIRLGEHFAAWGDSCVGVPRALALIGDDTMLVEAIRLPTLDRCLAKSFAPDACRAAGTWLRALHATPSDASDGCSLSTRDEIAERAEQLCAFVAKSSGNAFEFNTLHEVLQQVVEEAYPDGVDTRIAHGDFGLHNLFVTPAQGVIGFDTLAHWRMPAEVDIAYFLLLLETIPPLFASRRWQLRATTIARLRHEFLAGYFGPSGAPTARVLLFEMLTTLDKWASVIHSRRRARGLRGAAKHARLTLQQHWLQSRLRRQMGQLAARSESRLALPQLVACRSNI